jgi:tetratricopeptide (TPR) repeat protein
LADTYAYLAENFVVAPKEVMPKAKAAAEKALALDDNLAEAHTSVGIVKLDYEWDREGAQREMRRAMQLNAGSGWVRHWFAHSLEAQGRLDDAMREMRASLALDPLSIVIYWDVGNELLMAGKYDENLRHLEKADELFPNFPIIAYLRVATYYQKGDVQSAHRTIEALKAAHPEIIGEPVFMAVLGTQAAREGRPSEARQTLHELERLHRTQYVEPMMVTGLCSALGDHQALLLWLKRAYEERSTIYLYGPLAKYLYGSDPDAEAFLAKNR